MNFYNLLNKLQTIEEGTVAECGDMAQMGSTKQPDNVTMNVTINGTGKGGIRDLMDVLKDIEAGDKPHDAHALFGEPGSDHDKEEPIMGNGVEEMAAEEFENSPEGAPGQETAGIDAVLPTGDDLASKGVETLKVNGGGNPMQESLVAQLQSLYNDIKTR